MSVTIIHKKGSGVPAPESLEVAEFAVDVITGTLYTKTNSGKVIEIGSSGGGSGGSSLWEQNGDDIYYNDGNVGIGTHLPSEALDVATGSISINRSGAASPDSHEIKFKVDGAEHASINVENSYNMRFLTNSTERMRIAASGNVGIGTDNPGQKLTVSDTTTTNTSTYVSVVSGASGNAGITFGDNGANLSGGILYSNDDDALRFFKSGFSEAMRLDASGNLLVGKASAGLAVAGCRLQPTGDIRISMADATASTMVGFYKNGSATSVGRIESTSTATTYVTSSDESLKENIVDAPAGNIDDLKVRSFDWKVNGEHQDYGFVAQELETVAPYAVSKGETDEDMWGVDYSKLVPMLVKEIQDLKAEVAALKATN